MTFQNFQLNDAVGKRAENAVFGWCNRHGSAVKHPNGIFGTDIEWTTTNGVKLNVGVELIKKWAGEEEYPYQFYNLNTHKRARKMLNGEEPVLFVVSKNVERFMVILPYNLTPEMVPVESRAWLTGINGMFQRGSSEDPLTLAKCPWGCSVKEEWCFKVPRKQTYSFDVEAQVMTQEQWNAKLTWNGPKPLGGIEMLTNIKD